MRVQHDTGDELTDRCYGREQTARNKTWSSRGQDHASHRHQPRCAKPARGVLERGIHLSERRLNRRSDQRNVANEIGERQNPESPDEQNSARRRIVAIERRGESQRNCRGGNRPRQRYQQFQQTSTTELTKYYQVGSDEAHHQIRRRRDQRHRDAVGDRPPELAFREQSPIVLQRVLGRQHLRRPRSVPGKRDEHHHQMRQHQCDDDDRRKNADQSLKTSRPNGAARPPPFAGQSVLAFSVEPAEQRQSSDGAQCEHGCLDIGKSHRAVRLGREDLRRQHPQSAAEHVRRREGAECIHEHEEHRSCHRRHQQWKSYATQSLPGARAEPRCCFVERRVESFQAGRDEQEDVDVHRVGMDEHDGAYSLQSPRRLRHADSALDRARHNPTLPVEKQERDDADQRR